MSFDYSTVWTNSLRSQRVIVHLPVWGRDAPERVTTKDNGDIRTEWLTKCGGAVMHTFDKTPEGRWVAVADWSHGTLFANGHAQAIGAHYCKRCWRDQ